MNLGLPCVEPTHDPAGDPAHNTATDPCPADLTVAGRRYLTQAGFSRLLGVTPRTLARWDELRIGPPRIKIGKLVLYDLEKLPAWLERHESQPIDRRGPCQAPEHKMTDDPMEAYEAGYKAGWGAASARIDLASLEIGLEDCKKVVNQIRGQLDTLDPNDSDAGEVLAGLTDMATDLQAQLADAAETVGSA